MRTLLALNIVLFHFTPQHLHYLYPVIDNAYVFVGFFFLISGFVLTYNYADRALGLRNYNFYIARFARIYPTYLLTLLISLPMVGEEWHARSRAEFWQGMLLTPISMQGWIPSIATFWNTVGWTVSAEVALYLAFPFMLRAAARSRMWNWSAPRLILLGLTVWLVGLIPHSLYIVFNPDHLPLPINRFSYGIYLRALKFGPMSYLCIFLAGGILARVHFRLKLGSMQRLVLCVVALVSLGLFFQKAIPAGVPYVLIHGCILLPLFSMLTLGLAGPNPVAAVFSWKPLVKLGEATFALYLLHFNVFVMIHAYHLPERLHVAQWDPWISYVFLLVLAYAVMNLFEKPMRQLILGRMLPRPQAAMASAKAVEPQLV
ncbi:acyltransferase [Granulicella sp. WH15]|nr:acyltransferase [Granulicella sp. WH15]